MIKMARYGGGARGGVMGLGGGGGGGGGALAVRFMRLLTKPIPSGDAHLWLCAGLVNDDRGYCCSWA